MEYKLLDVKNKRENVKISESHDIMAKALDGRSLRQKIISSNIANIDTPFYKARDVDFESTLAKEAKKIDDKVLPLAKTDNMHLDPVDAKSQTEGTIFLRDGHMARNDANTVDLDIENSELSKNSIMFGAVSAALKKDAMLVKSIIDSSGKI